MDDLPDDDIWASLYHLATVATQLAEEESAKKVKKGTEKVIKNEKLKEKEEVVVENGDVIKKGCLESWLQKKKRSVLNFSNVYDEENTCKSHWLVGCCTNGKKPWNVSIFQVQESGFDGSGEGCSKWFEGFNSDEKKPWNVSINQGQESMSKKPKFYGSGEGCSKWSEGCSNNDQKQSRQKKKGSKNVIQIPSPELPEAFKNAISRYLNGGMEFTGEMMLVLERNLSWSDADKGQSRFALHTSKILRMDFLKPNEESFLRERNLDGSLVCMEVKIIEPSLKPGMLDLRFWESNSHYSLTGKWKSVVQNNNLVEGDFVQLWAFRIEGKLCFALCTVPSRKIPKKERKNKK